MSANGLEMPSEVYLLPFIWKECSQFLPADKQLEPAGRVLAEATYSFIYSFIQHSQNSLHGQRAALERDREGCGKKFQGPSELFYRPQHALALRLDSNPQTIPKK